MTDFQVETSKYCDSSRDSRREKNPPDQFLYIFGNLLSQGDLNFKSEALSYTSLL